MGFKPFTQVTLRSILIHYLTAESATSICHVDRIQRLGRLWTFKFQKTLGSEILLTDREFTSCCLLENRSCPFNPRCLRPDCYRNMTVQVYVRLLREIATSFQRGCASQDEYVFSRCSGHFAEELGEKAFAYRRVAARRISVPRGTSPPTGGLSGGPVKGARSACDVIHLTSFSVTESTMLSLIRALFP